MIAIRGATTIQKDCAEEIKGAVKELLCALKEKNELKDGEIISVIFSSTRDIHSFYPAKAAREAGFFSCALFSAVEPDIEGGLPLCIRTMILAEKSARPVNVYLRGAKALRRDISSVMNIALDGPAGSGKSTVAKRLAEDFNILYLDTGAMYRACALEVSACGGDIENADDVKKIISSTKLKVEYIGGEQHTFIGEEDVSLKIRSPEASMNASKISSYPFVREKMVEMQRKIASSTPCVLDGRDIGSAVLPDAPFKFFITAAVDARAERRYKELINKGYDVDFSRLKEEIILRDKQDSERKFSPLKRAEDAIVVDTSSMTVDEVVSFIKNKIMEKI